jgi:sodium transport system permease protein
MRSAIVTVFRKEMLEVSRDRKTLIFMIVLPLLIIPLLFDVTIQFMTDAEKEATEKTLDYAIFGKEQLPEAADAFANSGFPEVALDDPAEIQAAVDDERIDFALVIQPAGPGGQHVVELWYDNAPMTSTKVEARTKEVLDGLGADLRRKRFEALGIDDPATQQGVIEPVVVQPRGTAPMREVIGEQVGGYLPYVLLIFCFMGAMYPAIDLAAGEKERGTLETLLLVPIPRGQVVLGKFLVVFTAGVVTAVLAIAGIGGWLAWRSRELEGDLGAVLAAIGAGDLLLIATMLVPTAAIFASLLLAISIYAKSFKEAQSYIGALYLLVFLPASVATLPGVELDWATASIPIVNISLAIKELAKGTMDPTLLVAILGSSTLLAAGMLWAATWWFGREDVLFRQ